MKILVVYYSFEGNTRLIAKAIADELSADVMELRTTDEPRSKGFSKFFWGGRQVAMKIRPALLPMEKDPKDYDCLFIGTPVWAFSPVPAMLSFLEQVKFSGKKTALFCCSGGGMGKTFQKMRDLMPGNAVVSEMQFVEPRRKEQASVEKARKWAKEAAGLF